MAAANKTGPSSRVVEVDDVDDDSSSNGHCRCCHCGAPGPDGSSSQNYLRMKKHLQQMLEEKRSSLTPERELSSKIAHLNLEDHHAMEEIDSLVNFIEGRQHEMGLRDPKKAAKKARKKQRKLEEEERAKQQVKQAPVTAKSSIARTNDQVPNGMVRIKHNPLTNSTVITPLYGPAPPSSNFFPQQPTSAPATVIANGPVQRQVTQQKAAPKPTGSSRDAPVPVPAKPPVLASPQPQIPPSSSSGNNSSAAPQMVTIRRVMTSLADPVVTVTLKGDTSDSDRVLFTLVNGQVQQQSPSGSTVPAAPAPPKPRSSKPVVSETELALKQEQRKVKKKQKKLEKKEKKKSSKSSSTQQQQQQLQQSAVTPAQEPPRFQPVQYQNHFHKDNFSLDNLKLPPGITLTRVQEAHSLDAKQQQFPFQLLGSPSTKGKSTATDNKAKNFNAASPIIVSQPNAEPLGSFGGLAAPNVIVVDTRQIQEDQQHKQTSARSPPVKMRSIGIQTGCSDSEDEQETTGGTSATEGLSRKQKKKLRKKEKKAQHIQEAKRKEQSRKNPLPDAKPSVAPPPSGRLTNGAADLKKGKKKASRNHSRTDDKWEENIFVPKSDLDLERGDMDDDERELEAFKRFCFNSVPPERKEKVRVHLNVKDIFGKKPSLAANCK